MNEVTISKSLLTGIWVAIVWAQPPLQSSALNFDGKAESTESSVQVGPNDKIYRRLPPPPPCPGTGRPPPCR